MTKLNQIDLNIRLQLLNQAYSNLSTAFANDLKYGRKCSVSDRLNLAILAVYLDILECYQVVAQGVTTSTNCYTETEIQDLLQNASLLTGITFNPPGFTYEIPEGYKLNSNGTISPI